MNKMLLTVAMLIGIGMSVPSFAGPNGNVPYAAARSPQGYYLCQPPYQLISVPQLVTYYELQTRVEYKRQCLGYGRFGVCRIWSNPMPVNVQALVPVTRVVPANYCVFSGYYPSPVPVPYPYPN